MRYSDPTHRKVGIFSHIFARPPPPGGETCEILLANYKGPPMPFHYLYNWLLPLARFRKSRPDKNRYRKKKKEEELDMASHLWLAENVAAAGRHLEMDSPYSHYFPTCHPSAMMDSATPRAHFEKKLPTWHPLKKWTRPTSLPATPQLMDSAALRAHFEKIFPTWHPS